MHLWPARMEPIACQPLWTPPHDGHGKFNQHDLLLPYCCHCTIFFQQQQKLAITCVEGRIHLFVITQRHHVILGTLWPMHPCCSSAPIQWRARQSHWLPVQLAQSNRPYGVYEHLGDGHLETGDWQSTDQYVREEREMEVSTVGFGGLGGFGGWIEGWGGKRGSQILLQCTDTATRIGSHRHSISTLLDHTIILLPSSGMPPHMEELHLSHPGLWHKSLPRYWYCSCNCDYSYCLILTTTPCTIGFLSLWHNNMQAVQLNHGPNNKYDMLWPLLRPLIPVLEV